MAEAETPLTRIVLPGGPDTAGLVMSERGLQGQVIIRGQGGDQAFLAAVQGAIGMAPPTQPNTVASHQDLDLLWLSPEEWLLVAPPGLEAGLIQRLEQALTGVHAGTVDVSDARAIIRLEGTAARLVLAKGTPLDLRPHRFAPGRCAQTILARASVILRPVGRSDTYEVHVARSFAPYLWAWLLDAGREYGVRVAADAPPHRR
jgi:sarcosine oxidase subunit gamma